MGIIVGRGESKLSCDHSTCSVQSQYVSGENDGQRNVEDHMKKQGWQCTTGGRTFCPNHAYGKNNPSTPS